MVLYSRGRWIGINKRGQRLNGWWRSQSGDGQNLKADGQINTADGQIFTIDGDEGPWREVDGERRRQVCGGLTGCRGI